MGSSQSTQGEFSVYESSEQRQINKAKLKSYVSKLRFVKINKSRLSRYKHGFFRKNGIIGAFTTQYSPSLPVYVTHLGFGACEAVCSGNFINFKTGLSTNIQHYLVRKVDPFSNDSAEIYYIIPKKVSVQGTVVQITKTMRYLVRNIQINRNNIEKSKVFVDELSTKNTGHKGLAMSHTDFMERVDADDGSQGWKLAQTALSDNVSYQENFDRVYVSIGSNNGRLGSVSSSSSNKLRFDTVDSKISSNINQTLDDLIKQQHAQKEQQHAQKINSSIRLKEDYSPEPTIIEKLEEVKQSTIRIKTGKLSFPDTQIGQYYNQQDAYDAFRTNLL